MRKAKEFWLFSKPHLPSVVTLSALCTSFSSIYFATNLQMTRAILCVWVGGFLDAVDGALARFLDACSPFGAEIDSLADLVSFGVSPALMVYFSQLKGTEYEFLAWGCCCTFVCCMAVRLARFNVEHVDTALPSWSKNFFKGVPAPAGATLLMFPVYAKFAGFDYKINSTPEFYMAWLLFTAMLLISNIRTFSMKGIKLPSRKRTQLPLFAVLIGGILLSYLGLSDGKPLDKTGWQLSCICTIMYIASFPVSHGIFLNLCSSHHGRQGKKLM